MVIFEISFYTDKLLVQLTIIYIPHHLKKNWLDNKIQKELLSQN